MRKLILTMSVLCTAAALLTSCTGGTAAGVPHAVTGETAAGGSENAYSLLDQKKYTEAESAFEKRIQDGAALPADYIGLFQTYRQDGRNDEAEKTILEAKEKYPDHIGVLHGLALMQKEKKSYAEAAETYDRIVRADSTDEKAKKNLADCARQTGDPDTYLKYSLELLQSAPDSTVFLNDAIQAGLSSSGPEEAEKQVLDTVQDENRRARLQTLYDAYGMWQNSPAADVAEKLVSPLSDGIIGPFGVVDSLDGISMIPAGTDGKLSGKGISVQTVFGDRGIVIGEWKDGKLQGDGMLACGISKESNKYIEKYSCSFRDGLPEGIAHYEKTSYVSRDSGEPEAHLIEYGDYQFSSGKAQGETRIYRKDYVNGGWQDTEDYVRSIYQDGKQQKFTVETQKDGTKEAYSAYISTYSNITFHYDSTPSATLLAFDDSAGEKSAETE